MLVGVDGFRERWARLRAESLSHSSYSVVLFVSCLDVDAFAASIMLGALLQKHLILYKTEPVIGYSALQRAMRRLESAVRNVVLVGCGSAVDLDEYLQLDGGAATVHVFDCKRPWNLNNLFASDHVVCYEDCDVADLEPYREAYVELAQAAAEAPAETAAGTLAEAADSDFGGLESDTTQNDATQNDAALFVPEPAEPRRAPGELLEAYYAQGTHQSSTTAVQVYTYLSAIGETSLRMLWLAIVGLTAAEAQHPRLYALLMPSLQAEMKRLQPDGAHVAANSNARELVFSAEPDFALFLMRQWCLYESMVHSSYINAKLFLWREDGRKKLHKLLARIGITLQDAKQAYTHMRPHLKRELKSKLDSVSEIYGIEGITRTGVVRQYGLLGAMSAGDCVESVAALLETGAGEALPMHADGEQGDDDDGADAGDAWVRNFWAAWDAFDEFDRMRLGVRKAQLLQRAVVATANYVFDKNLPKDLQSYRMVVVQDAPDLPVFFNPLSLQRLSAWVFEGCAELNAASLPMVFAVLNEKKGVYLVHGVAGRTPRDARRAPSVTEFNAFGAQFQDTAARINARIRVDAFDSAIIELSREDLPRFLEALDELRSV